ncbi:MAG: hypothetical protein ACOZIN_05185 [Myxococcota bacterium]
MSRVDTKAPAAPKASKAKVKSSKARAPKAAKAAKTAGVAVSPKLSDRFDPLKAAVAEVAQPTAEAAAPAVMRALYGAASMLEGGAAAEAVASEAAKVVFKSPEMMAAFKHALPALEAATTAVGGQAAGAIAKKALPLLANGETVKAVIKVAGDVGGPSGRRLVGAAIRGLSKGGLTHCTAEVAATAAKVGAKATAATTAGKALGKALPLVGNALNLLSVGTALVGLIKSFKDPNTTGGGRLAHALHLACSVVGCFIPPVGVAGDVALMGAKAAGVK